MRIGKLPEITLKRSVLNQIGRRRKEVLVGPGIGEDCSVIAIEEDEVLVLSTDPITGTVKDIGTFAVHITANDIASNGADIIGIMLTILLPDTTEEADLRLMMQDIEAVCKELEIEVLGGHTEVTKAVCQPIVTVTGVGKLKRKDLIKTAGAKPGQEIVMSKWAGIEGTAIIASTKEEELLKIYPQSFITNAKSFINYISVVPEAKVAREVGVSSMHDVTEGGIFGALWEMGVASQVGFQVDLDKILLKQETVEICEFYDLNPYQLISSGCMLMVTDRGNQLVESLKAEGITAAVIGHITEGKDRLIINKEDIRFLEPPKSDELYKVV
ncbi:MAG TPA: hydrogenase maturation factor [Clostridiales bacterium]|nr:hydrogenase maturation factor [Clostridiales bacterium]